jgi:hypothetical protein
MTTVCLGLGDRKKHTHTTNKLFLQDQTSAGGTAAPSASIPPSAESDPASDDDTIGGSPPRRNLSAPRLGHHCRGLLQEPGPSRRFDRPLRSLSQLSSEDISPAHGLGNPTPVLVPPVDGPARLRPTKPLFEPTPPLSMLISLPPAPAHHRAAEGSFISKISFGWQGRPSRGTPTPPGYGYLTRHLPHRATHTWLSGSVSRQASPNAQNEEKHDFTPKYTHVQAPTATMNKHRHSRCHYKRNSGSTPAGMNNLHIGEPAGQRTPGDSPATSAAAAMVPGRTLPSEGSCSRPLAGDEN